MCTPRVCRAVRFSLYGVLLWSMGFAPLLSAQTAQMTIAATRTQAAAVFSPALSICAQPVFAVPLIDSASYFGLGGGLSLGVEYSFRGNPQLFLSGSLDYSFLPVKEIASSVSLLSALAGAGAYFWFTPRLGVKVTGQGGYHIGFLNDTWITQR